MEQTQVQTKACTKCGAVKPLDDFGRRRAGRLKRRSECKTCHGQFVSKQPEGETKICCACGVKKPIEEFYRLRKNLPKRQSECKTCQRKRSPKFRKNLKGRFWRAKADAKIRKKCWGLSYTEYEQVIIEGLCCYCNDILPTGGSGLDRKDSAQGYIAGNVVPCCRRCNTIKGDFFTFEEMLALGRVIQDIRRKREETNDPQPSDGTGAA